MTLAAVMPTLRPSIWALSWAARSSQRSACAGEVLSAASSASAAASMVDRRNPGFIAICECPFAPLKRLQAVGARVGGFVKLLLRHGRARLGHPRPCAKILGKT